MTPDQVRAARKLLGWSRHRLGGQIGGAVSAVIRFEPYRAGGSANPETLAAIRTALEAAGVEFIEENGGGAGVRMRNPS